MGKKEMSKKKRTLLDAALIYFVLTYVMTKLLGLLERRMRRSENSVA